jgi:PAS domain S-box-containing protein
MSAIQIVKLVEGTADAAFAIDASGLISAWNNAAEEMFGLSSADAIGLACHEVVEGTNENGVLCSKHCAIQRAVEINCPVPNFDVRVQTKMGKQWSNISILIMAEPGSGARHAVHIVRRVEKRKRLERLVHNFVTNEIELEHGMADGSSPVSGLSNLRLTVRETEVLRWLARGAKTDAIGEELCISRSTVRNHIKHILSKLEAHTRPEAVDRAQGAGLI